MTSTETKPTQPQLTLQLAEQPAKRHRFRYLKEIKDNRMGSILHSRSSDKVPVKVRISVLPSLNADCRFKLVGCTLFEDLAPHPFYLLGDDCKVGVFEKEFDFPVGLLEYTVSLERIGIVCTRKKQPAAGRTKATAGALGDSATPATPATAATEPEIDTYQERAAKYNFFNKSLRSNLFQGKDVNKLRLAFQLFVQHDGTEQWVRATCDPVASEVIGDAKIFSELTVDCVIPNTVTRLDQDVWLYMKDPLPGESVTQFKVLVEDSKRGVRLPDPRVKTIKKHLVVFDCSGLIGLSGVLDLTVQVLDCETGETSEPEKLTLSLPDEGSAEPLPKKQRGMKSNITDIIAESDFLNDLIENFVDVDSSEDSKALATFIEASQ